MDPTDRLLALDRLPVHVRDLDPVDRATGRSEAERGSGIVGVDVDLERGRIAHDEKGIAEQIELALEPVDVEPLTFDHEHGAVAELRELLVHRLDGEQDRAGGHLGDRLAGDGGP